MNETRKAIIELIEEYMDKTLSEGCYIELDYESNWNNAVSTSVYIKYEEWYTLEELCFRLFWCYNYKILWHYDITSVLKYIESNGYKIECAKDRFRILWDYHFEIQNYWFINSIPNKPLH